MVLDVLYQLYSIVAACIRRKVSFSLVRSNDMCIRGRRPVSSINELVQSTLKEVVTSKITSRVSDLI